MPSPPPVIPILSSDDEADVPSRPEQPPLRRRRRSTDSPPPAYKDVPLKTLLIPDFSKNHPRMTLENPPHYRTPKAYDTEIPGLQVIRPGSVVHPDLVVATVGGEKLTVGGEILTVGGEILAYGYSTRYDAKFGTDRTNKKKSMKRRGVMKQLEMAEWEQWEEDGYGRGYEEVKEEGVKREEGLSRIEGLPRVGERGGRVIGVYESSGQNPNAPIRISATPSIRSRYSREVTQEPKFLTYHPRQQTTAGPTLDRPQSAILIEDSDDESIHPPRVMPSETINIDDVDEYGFQRHELLLEEAPEYTGQKARESSSLSTISNQHPFATPPRNSYLTPPPTNPRPKRVPAPLPVYISSSPPPQPIFNQRKRTTDAPQSPTSDTSSATQQHPKRARFANSSTHPQIQETHATYPSPVLAPEQEQAALTAILAASPLRDLTPEQQLRKAEALRRFQAVLSQVDWAQAAESVGRTLCDSDAIEAQRNGDDNEDEGGRELVDKDEGKDGEKEVEGEKAKESQEEIEGDKEKENGNGNEKEEKVEKRAEEIKNWWLDVVLKSVLENCVDV